MSSRGLSAMSPHHGSSARSTGRLVRGKRGGIENTDDSEPDQAGRDGGENDPAGIPRQPNQRNTVAESELIARHGSSSTRG
jgi:hypothetical protein